jgi:FeS assembly SUF system protein
MSTLNPQPDQNLTPESPAPATPPTPEPAKTLKDQVIDSLREVYDPEVPVNIYDLGLIYDILIDPTNKVEVKMTLTSPACPVAQSLPLEVRAAVSRILDVSSCEVDLVWDPPWGPAKMTDAAKLRLGLL